MLKTKQKSKFIYFISVVVLAIGTTGCWQISVKEESGIENELTCDADPDENFFMYETEQSSCQNVAEQNDSDGKISDVSGNVIDCGEISDDPSMNTDTVLLNTETAVPVNASDGMNPAPTFSSPDQNAESEVQDSSTETDSFSISVEKTDNMEQTVENDTVILSELPDDLHTNIENPTATDILLEIYETVSSYADVSVYFTDVEEEYWFGIGEENRYHTASTIKPVYCQYLLSAGIDPVSEVTLQQVSRPSSTGKLSADNIGTTFTVDELIEYSLRYSDNQAYRLLYEAFGIEGYNKYVKAFGEGGLFLDEEYEWSRVTPQKLSRVMLEMYRYGEKNSILIEHLKNATFNAQIAAGTGYEVAHKYGSNGGTDGYHDTAIVYAPERAYVLTILTYIHTEQTEDENAVFRNVAELCDILHGILFLS